MANAFITRRAGTLVKNIANAEVTLDFSSVTYDGSQHAPKIQSVTMDGEPLTNLLHYYATITPQTDAGDYYVTVHGLGEYGGVKQVPWSIAKRQGSVSLAPDSITIQGELGTTGQVIITYEGDGELTISESGIVSAQILDYDPVLENNSWETIAQVAAAGLASKAWNLGDTKTIELNGNTYHAQIIGFDHDDLDSTDAKYDDDKYNSGKKKASITFQTQELIKGTPQRMNISSDNSCSWKNCYMRVNYINKVKNQMPVEILNFLRIVTKKTGQSASDSTIIETADELFLLSNIEICGLVLSSNEGEGNQYDYYISTNNFTKCIAGQQSGSPWWTRSPTTSDKYSFMYVSSSGVIGISSTATVQFYIAPAFCI